MELTNLQMYEYQASIKKRLENYRRITDKLIKCFQFHLHGDTQNDSISTQLTSVVNCIDLEIRNLQRFELRMVIIAPMKSGKSTIINALIGDSILPTRANSMTVLPTEVVFKNDTEKPTLLITNEVIEVIMNIQRQINKYFNDNKLLINEQLANQPQLIKLAQEIGTSHEYEFLKPSTETDGVDKIQRILTSINDIVRIYLILSSNSDPVFSNVSLEPFLRSNIRVEIPVSSLSFGDIKDIESSMGNLTIVDTPGFNEAGASEQLMKIVSREIQKASIVILVLNFTSFGTEADERLLKDINTIRATNLEKDCIYMIINKVDQRRRGDMTPDEVKKFIATKYRIEEKTRESRDRRIFEMKGIHCLVYRRFIKEIEQLKDVKKCIVGEMKTAQQLIDELYQVDDDDDKNNKEDIEYLRKKGEKMWRKAGLIEFIEGPIQDLFRVLAPRSIRSAINVCYQSVIKIEKEARERQLLLTKDKGDIEKEKLSLEEDCEKLNSLKKQNESVFKEKLTEFEANLAFIVREAEENADNKVNELFSKEIYKIRVETTKYYKKYGFGVGLITGGLIAAIIVSAGPLGMTAAALAGISGSLMGGSVLKHADYSVEFETEGEARSFVESFQNDISSICKYLYKEICEKTNELLKEMNTSMEAHVILATAPVVEGIKTRFKETLNMDVSFTSGSFEAQSSEIDIDPNSLIEAYRPLLGYSVFGRKTKIEYELKKEKTSAVKQEEDGAPVVKQEEDGAPVVKQEEDGAPVVKQEEDGAPVVKQEEDGAPVVKQEEDGAPVVKQEEAGAPVVKLQISQNVMRKMCRDTLESKKTEIKSVLHQYTKGKLREKYETDFQTLNKQIEGYIQKMADTLAHQNSGKDRIEQFNLALRQILTDIEKEGIEVRKIAKKLNINYNLA